MSNEIGLLLFGKDVPAPKVWVICKGENCGAILTSERSIKVGMGQRCYRKHRGLSWPLRKRGDGQGVPISDEPFAESGGAGYRRKKYDSC